MSIDSQVSTLSVSSNIQRQSCLKDTSSIQRNSGSSRSSCRLCWKFCLRHRPLTGKPKAVHWANPITRAEPILPIKGADLPDKDEGYHGRTDYNQYGTAQARTNAISPVPGGETSPTPTDLSVFLWKRARAERLGLPTPEFRLLLAQNPVTSNNDEVGSTGLDEEARSLPVRPPLSNLEEPRVEAHREISRISCSPSSDGKSDEEFDELFDDDDDDDVENTAQTTASPAMSRGSTAWLSNVSKGDEEVPASDDEGLAEATSSARQDSPRHGRIPSSPSHLRPSLSTREPYEIVPESPTLQPASPLFTPPSSPTFSQVEVALLQRNVVLDHDTDPSLPPPTLSTSNQGTSSSASGSSFTPFPTPRKNASKSLANDDEAAGVGDSSSPLFDEQYAKDWDEQGTSGHGTPLSDDFMDDPMHGENDDLLYPTDAESEGEISNEHSSNVNDEDREEKNDAMAMDTEPGEWQKDDNDELRPPEVNASATAPGNPIIVGMPTNDEVDMLDDGELQYPNGADDDDGKHSNADPSSFSDHSHDESIGIANELLDIESSSNGSPVSRRPHLQVDLSRLQHPGYNELPTPTSLLDENLHSADTEPAIDHLEQLDRAAFSNVSLEDGEIRERASSRASNDRGLTSEALGAINALPLEPEEGELTERRPPSTINPPVVPSPISPPAGRNFIMKYTEPKRKRRRKVENDPEPGPVSKKRRVNAVSNAKSANAPPASPDSPRFELPFSSSSAGPRDLGNSFPGPSRPRVIKTVTLDYMIEWVNMLTRLNYLVDRGQAVRTDEQKLTTTLEEVIAGTEDIVYALRDQVQAWRSGKGRWNQGKPSQAQKLVEVLQDHKSHSVWGEVVREEIANLLDYFCKEVRELEDMLGLYC